METKIEEAHRGLRSGVLLPILLGLCLATGAQAATQTRTSAFAYDAATGLLTKEIIEPNNPQLCLVTEYSYDGYGNKTASTTRNCNGSASSTPENKETSAPAVGDPAIIEARTTTTGYDVNGQFPLTRENALNQSETKTFDARFGAVTTLTGPNYLTTQWQYDGFGRKTLEIRADGTQTQWSYRYCAGVNGGTDSCPYVSGNSVKYLIQVTPLAANGVTATGPWTKTYYDSLGREIRTETQGNDLGGSPGANVYQDTQYDSLGRVWRISRPYANGQTAYWTVYSYDALGRVISETYPTLNGGTPTTATTTKAYNGLSTTVTDALGHAKTTVKNSQGQIVRVTDALNNSITYQHDPFGNLVRTIDPNGNATTLSYDLRGRKIAMDDPDMGSWSYVYDALGQLVQQTDAKSQVSTLTYDKLGRMTRRAELDLVSTWTFDDCNRGIGKLCRASADNGYERTHDYDSLGRPRSTSTKIGIFDYYYQLTTYYPNGRVATQTWNTPAGPSGVGVSYIYTDLGYLKEVRNAQNDDLYWQADSRDAEGHLVQQTYGNNVVTQQVYDPGSGQIKNLYAGAGNGVLALSYQYDSLGNIQTRSDSNQNLSESFTFDTLNRLKTAQVNFPGADIVTTNYNYDALGNITYRSDVGNYSYGGTNNKPHAVTAISGGPAGSNHYHYDANGNLFDSDNRFEEYTSFNMPSLLASGPLDQHYLYGPEHQRVKMISSASGTTLYLHPDNSGGLSFEQETDNNGIVEQRHYITAGGQVVAMLKIRNGVTSVRYFHRDNLGSTAAVTDEDGVVVERLAYEPFGKRRFPNGTVDPNDTIHGQETERGYTNHEHLDELGLIHMNGRIYDPLLGRFMSADPTIQNPYDLQSYNRYSYVGNNPLIFTDPTGYFGLKDLLRASVPPTGIPSFDMNTFHSQPGQTQVDRFIMSSQTAYTIGYIAAAYWGGSYGAAAYSSYYRYQATGSVTKAAWSGVLSLGTTHAFTAIGDRWHSGTWGNVAGHTVVGCASTAAGGGECGAGALSAAFPAAIGPVGDYGGAGNLVIQSVIGGTASILGGGKFGNGAQTAAFGYLFNHCAHNGCWTTSEERAYLDRGDFRGYYTEACRGGDLNACRFYGIATGEEPGPSAVLRKALLANGYSFAETNTLVQSTIPLNLANDYANLLPQSEAAAAFPSANAIRDYHWTEFSKYGLPPSTFGGTPFGKSFDVVPRGLWCTLCAP